MPHLPVPRPAPVFGHRAVTRPGFGAAAYGRHGTVRGLPAAGLGAAAPAWAAAPARSACAGDIQALLHAAPAMPPQAVCLKRQPLRWPPATAPVTATTTAGPRLRWHQRAQGQVVAVTGAPVQGADGTLARRRPPRAVPTAPTAGFKCLADGATLAVPAADQPQRPALHRGRRVRVRAEVNAQERVLRALATPIAGPLHGLHAAAEGRPGLGAMPAPRRTGCRLWAPPARAVALCLHNDGWATTPRRDTVKAATGTLHVPARAVLACMRP